MNSRKLRPGRWVQHVERVDGRRMTGLRFQYDDGSFADEAPQMEWTTIRHEMPDGSTMTEQAWRPIALAVAVEADPDAAE